MSLILNVFGQSSKYVAVFVNPSAVFDAASKTPVKGFITTPATPIVDPLKIPAAPSFRPC